MSDTAPDLDRIDVSTAAGILGFERHLLGPKVLRAGSVPGARYANGRWTLSRTALLAWMRNGRKAPSPASRDLDNETDAEETAAADAEPLSTILDEPFPCESCLHAAACRNGLACQAFTAYINAEKEPA